MKGDKDCTHVDHNYLDNPLPFKIKYTNIALLLVYMIISVKRSQLVVVYMGTVWFPF